MWQLAGRHYLPSIRNKPFSPAAGNLVSRALTEKFGPYAGWAHNTLFIAELPGVRDRVAEAERLARKLKGKAEEAEGGEEEDSDDSESESESDCDGEEEDRKPPPAKKRNTAAARAAEAAATFNKIKREEEAGGAAAVPRTPGGK